MSVQEQQIGVQELTRNYLDQLWELRDKRMDSYPLMGSPIPTLAASFGYVAVCGLIGPAIVRRYRSRNEIHENQENNSPSKYKSFINFLMILYNCVQIVVSSYIVIYGFKGGWFNGYSFVCQPVDYSDSPQALMMARITWLYFATKFIEFADTLFFLARGKLDQITFLHLFHHAVMPLYMWPAVRFIPGGHGSLAGFLNSAVHVVMYFYYLLAALGPNYRKYLWWKQYLTWLQLLQFGIVFVHAMQLLFVEDCGYPKEYAYFGMALMVMMASLFLNFYSEAYIKGRRSTTVRQRREQNGSAVYLKDD